MSVKNDNRHLYLQVIDYIKKQIDCGVFKEKEKLPSEFELSKKLGVSRATLREALRMLEEENIIIRRHGVGTFVNSKPMFQSGIEQLSSVTDMIINAGKKPGTILLSSSIQQISKDDAIKLNRTDSDQVVSIERVRTADGEPVVYCVDNIPSIFFKDDTIPHYESIFDLLHVEANIDISYAVTQIEPIGIHEKVSPILQCGPETSLLVLKQIHYNKEDLPIFYSTNYFRADQFVFHVVRKRS